MRARAPKGGCWANGKFYKGGQFMPRVILPSPKISDEELIHMAMTALPVSVEAAQALHRYLAGRASNRDKAILDGRRLTAVQILRDRSASDREWKHWNNVYAGLANGI